MDLLDVCLVDASILKGQSHEIFYIPFFHLPAPPGPIRDVQGPFRILMIFHGDIRI